MATPSLGTAFADGVRAGSFQSTDFNYSQLGGLLSPVISYSLQTSVRSTFFNSGITQAGPIPFTPSSPLSLVTFEGYSNVLQFDSVRGVYFEVVNAGGTPNNITFTISGWDFWNQKVVEQVTVPSGSAQAAFFRSKKTYRYIKSIYASATSPSIGISIQTDLTFGFPYYIPKQSFCYVEFGGRPDYYLTTGTSNANIFLSPPATNLSSKTVNALLVGDPTLPATATTGDPRGLYAPATDGNQISFVGSWLIMNLYVPGFDPSTGTILAPNNSLPSLNYCFGVPQYSTGWQ